MRGWYILGAVLLLLTLLLALPVGVRARWDGQPLVYLRLGPLRFQIFPGKKKPKKEKKVKEDASSSKKSPEKKNRPKPNREQILYTVSRAVRLLGKLPRRLRRGLRLDPLVLRLTVAGPDPADAAALYGQLCGALSALLPGLRQLLWVGHEDIRLSLDFDRMACTIWADIGVSMRLFHLLCIGFSALGSLIGWALGYRRLSPAPAEAPAAPQRIQA